MERGPFGQDGPLGRCDADEAEYHEAGVWTFVGRRSCLGMHGRREQRRDAVKEAHAKALDRADRHAHQGAQRQQLGHLYCSRNDRKNERDPQGRPRSDDL